MRRRTDVGQATVEFALVVPVVILLLVGIVQIGRLVGMQMVLDRGPGAEWFSSAEIWVYAAFAALGIEAVSAHRAPD